MNPEGEKMVYERREVKAATEQINTQAERGYEPVLPSRVVIYEVRDGQIFVIDPKTDKDL